MVGHLNCAAVASVSYSIRLDRMGQWLSKQHFLCNLQCSCYSCNLKCIGCCRGFAEVFKYYASTMVDRFPEKNKTMNGFYFSTLFCNRHCFKIAYYILHTYYMYWRYWNRTIFNAFAATAVCLNINRWILIA